MPHPDAHIETGPQRFAVVADAPDLSGIAWPDGAPDSVPAEVRPPTSRVQIAKTGRFRHPKYGKFTVTRGTFDAFVRNFEAGIPTDELPVDFDHEPDYGGSTAACGWIKKLVPDGDKLFAVVAWTWEGAYAIREQTYRYVSPTWSLSYVDEAGTTRGPTMLAFGLTNRPFFTMPAVSLSQTFSAVELDRGEQLVVEEPGPWDADEMFGSLVVAGMLDEGHREAFGLHYPGNAALLAEEPERLDSFVHTVRGIAEVFGHVPEAATDPLRALAREVQDRARNHGVHWWVAFSQLAGDATYAELAPPPVERASRGDGRPNDDMLARSAAWLREISYLDGAQYVELDRAVEAAGYDAELRMRRRAERDDFLERAQAAERDRRREALAALLRQRAASHSASGERRGVGF